MNTGELHFTGEAGLERGQKACLERLYDFSASRPIEAEKCSMLPVRQGSMAGNFIPVTEGPIGFLNKRKCAAGVRKAPAFAAFRITTRFCGRREVRSMCVQKNIEKFLIFFEKVLDKTTMTWYNN